MNVKPASYLAIKGKVEPSGEAFSSKIKAIYSVAFTINRIPALPRTL